MGLCWPVDAFWQVVFFAGFALDLVGFKLVWLGTELGLVLGQGLGPGCQVGRWAGLARLGLVLWFGLALGWVSIGLGWLWATGQGCLWVMLALGRLQLALGWL